MSIGVLHTVSRIIIILYNILYWVWRSVETFTPREISLGKYCFRDRLSKYCFRVSVMFHFMFVHYTFSSVWVAEWPPFGK